MSRKIIRGKIGNGEGDKRKRNMLNEPKKQRISLLKHMGFFGFNRIHFIIDIDLLGFFKAYLIFRFFRLTNYFFKETENEHIIQMRTK